MTSILLALSLSLAPTPKSANEATPAAKLKAALDEPGAVVIENKSLTDFVQYIKARIRSDVVLDQGHLAMMGIDPNSPMITVNSREGKLRDGFNAALAPLNLRLGIVGGTLVISTEDGLITKQMRQRVSVTPGPIGTILADLASRTGANIVLDPRQKKKFGEAACELELSDVTLETAVRLCSEVSGFRTLRMGNVLFVTSEDRAKELRADADGPAPAGSAIPGFPSVDLAVPGGLAIPAAPVVPPAAGGANPPPPPSR